MIVFFWFGLLVWLFGLMRVVACCFYVFVIVWWFCLFGLLLLCIFDFACCYVLVGWLCCLLTAFFWVSLFCLLGFLLLLLLISFACLVLLRCFDFVCVLCFVGVWLMVICSRLTISFVWCSFNSVALMLIVLFDIWFVYIACFFVLVCYWMNCLDCFDVCGIYFT